MLATRILTAIGLLAVLGAVIASGSAAAFTFLAATIVGLAAWEWDRLRREGFAVTAVMSGLLVIGCTLFAVNPAPWLSRPTAAPLGAFAATFFWIIVWPIFLRKPQRDALRGFAGKLTTVIVLTAAFFAALQLYLREPRLLLALIFVSIIADTFAYFVGKRFGRRKLAPAISPGKTIEGAVGGLVAVALAYAVWVYYSGWHWWWVPVFVVLGVLSIIGDLFESLLKRQAGVKDSSHLLPGHGGVLDRIDAQLPVLPVGALAFHYLPLR